MVQDASGNINGFIINDVLHDSRERIGQIVWSAVTELIFKVVNAPVKRMKIEYV